MARNPKERDHEEGFNRGRNGDGFSDFVEEIVEDVDIFEIFRTKHDRLGRKEGMNHRRAYGVKRNSSQGSTRSKYSGSFASGSASWSWFDYVLFIGYPIWCVYVFLDLQDGLNSFLDLIKLLSIGPGVLIIGYLGMWLGIVLIVVLGALAIIGAITGLYSL